MTTIWRANPSVSYWSINELRDAIQLVGGSPPEWTGAARLPAGTRVRAAHVLEIKEAMQRLWNDRGLGLIPNWTTGVEPGLPAPTQPSVLIRDTDILNLRDWFNHWEGWGSLRGVHWFDSGRSDLTGTFWNVELVYGVSSQPAENEALVYDSDEVAKARRHCVAARNYGLVNIVRIDWKEGHAVPTNPYLYGIWREHFNRAVNELKDVATIFIVGNEPTLEPHDVISGTQYGDAFNALYGDTNKVAGVMYLAAGPAAFSHTDVAGYGFETDIQWLRSASNAIHDLDGWALHTYGSPYLNNAAGGALCDTATVDCPFPQGSTLGGEASFRRYEDYIEEIRGDWAGKPVYITETNTQGFDAEGQTNGGKPSASYVTGWIQTTYEEIRRLNTEKNAVRNDWPRILCLCWFVDDNQDGNWGDFALSNDTSDKLSQARTDFKASDTSTGISPADPTSNLAPSSPIIEHRTGISILSNTVS